MELRELDTKQNARKFSPFGARLIATRTAIQNVLEAPNNGEGWKFYSKRFKQCFEVKPLALNVDELEYFEVCSPIGESIKADIVSYLRSETRRHLSVKQLMSLNLIER